jgi:16S rRNA (guanine527-N7)-methyltransferase
VAKDFQFARDGARIDTLARALGQDLPAATVERLGRYVELVARWNQKLDLTAASTAAAQVEVLLADALMLARAEVVPGGSRCVDIGSGAGAPALPLAILREDIDTTLVEPLRKRVAFLRTALGTLDLVARCRVLESKLDADAPVVSGAPFEVALSRATFSPEIWVRAGTKLAARTLVLLAKQGPPATPPGTQLARVVEYRLPDTGAERSIAVYVKPRA